MAIIELTVRCVIDLIKACAPRSLSAEGTVGFDDPAETGMLLGLIGIVNGALGSSKHIRVRINGDFNEKQFDITCRVKGKTTLFRLLLPIIRYCLAKPIWRIIKAFITNRKGKVDNDNERNQR